MSVLNLKIIGMYFEFDGMWILQRGFDHFFQWDRVYRMATRNSEQPQVSFHLMYKCVYVYVCIYTYPHTRIYLQCLYEYTHFVMVGICSGNVRARTYIYDAYTFDFVSCLFVKRLIKKPCVMKSQIRLSYSRFSETRKKEKIFLIFLLVSGKHSSSSSAAESSWAIANSRLQYGKLRALFTY